MSLKDRLEEYSKSNMYPFHMPGHKRMFEGPYKIDMTEVEGVDNLHHPTGVIALEQQRIAKIYNSKESLMLVGGSTVGNLAAIYAACNEGDTIVIQRNSHKSVYNGAIIRHLKVEYINPSWDADGIFHGVTSEMVEAAIENYSPKAVVLTTPSYEGYHCNIEDISNICHEKGVILIVDQAHGAHLGFHPDFKHSAVGFADITIQSLHKTLPCLTQTALMHICGKLVDSRKIKEALEIFETSSPSYVLMDSISRCMDFLEEKKDIFGEYMDKLADFYGVSGQLRHLHIIDESNEIKDKGKIVISTRNAGITGVELANLLREKYEIETELSSFSYVLAMTSIVDTKEGFDRLKKALLEIDGTLKEEQIQIPEITFESNKVMEPFEAKNKSAESIAFDEANGRISNVMVCLYPPGVPVIVPGEEIKEQNIKLIKDALEKSIQVTGLISGTISVVK